MACYINFASYIIDIIFVIPCLIFILENSNSHEVYLFAFKLIGAYNLRTYKYS